MESRIGKGRELSEAVLDFESLIESSEIYCDSTKRLSRVLSVFFAMKSAFLVRACWGLAEDELGETVMDTVGGGRGYSGQESLPKLNSVRSAKETLVAAVASSNGPAIVSALEEMGVFALCPIPNEQLSRMEQVAALVSGRARLVFLVELTLFAVELGDLNSARKYVTEAWSYDPSAWELYIVCVAEGLFELKDGNTPEAVRWLEKSIAACQTDEHASLYCAVRAPNFLLARKLFERGERVAVLSHLMQCKNVWQWPHIPIDLWIELIERGATPDFHGFDISSGMNRPSCRLDLQWQRARYLEMTKEPNPATSDPKSPEEVVAARKKLQEECERRIGAGVNKQINYLNE